MLKNDEFATKSLYKTIDKIVPNHIGTRAFRNEANDLTVVIITSVLGYNCYTKYNITKENTIEKIPEKIKEEELLLKKIFHKDYMGKNIIINSYLYRKWLYESKTPSMMYVEKMISKIAYKIVKKTIGYDVNILDIAKDINIEKEIEKMIRISREKQDIIEEVNKKQTWYVELSVNANYTEEELDRWNGTGELEFVFEEYINEMEDEEFEYYYN